MKSKKRGAIAAAHLRANKEAGNAFWASFLLDANHADANQANCIKYGSIWPPLHLAAEHMAPHRFC